MKHLLLTTIAAVVLVGCGESNNTESDDALRDAVKAGNIEAVKKHLTAGVDVNAKDGGWTPLHYAAIEGYKEIVRLLLVNGADIRVTFVYSASLEIFENVWNQVGCLYIVAFDRLWRPISKKRLA